MIARVKAVSLSAGHKKSNKPYRDVQMLAEFNRWSREGQMEQAAPVLSQRDALL